MGFSEVYRYVAGKADWFAAGWARDGRQDKGPYIGELAAPDVPTCRPDDRVGEVRRRVSESGWTQCVVVDDGGVVVGLLDPERLAADADLPAELAMRLGPSTYRPSLPVAELAEHMHERRLQHALVTDADGVLIGWLDRVRVDAARSQAVSRNHH